MSNGRIIQIRGTSGSGKSTLVRSILFGLHDKAPFTIERRRQPLGYVGHMSTGQGIVVLGHYETACGGCDTITDREQMFDLMRTHARSGRIVLAEGVILSDEVPRTIELAKEINTVVLRLDTPLADCLAGIRARREAKNNFKELNPANTQKRIPAIRRACERLAQGGVQVETVTRESAHERLAALVGMPL